MTVAPLSQEHLERLLDSHRYPLQYHALVLEVTAQCNAACAMCYQSAGPRGSDALGRASLDKEDLVRILGEARSIEALDPRVHIVGGEAFLRPRIVLELVAAAKRLGYLEIVTTTNATWARSADQASALCSQLAAQGLTAMAVSWDWWHVPYIQPEWVGNCLRACAEVGIETNLRVLTSRTHGIEEALAPLDADALAQVDRISSTPVLAIGRGAATLDPADVYAYGSMSDSCHTALSVTVNAWGNVFPCCSGFDQTESYLVGNVADEPLPDIVARMSTSPLVRVLVLGGVAKLYALLGVDLAESTSYKSICEACWSLFDDPERVDEVTRALADLTAQVQAAGAS